jgi:CHAT domain-containing protein
MGLWERVRSFFRLGRADSPRFPADASPAGRERAAALLKLLQFRVWDDRAKRFLLDRLMLLDPAADHDLWQWAMQTPDERELRRLGTLRGRLAYCRRAGVEQAFEENWVGSWNAPASSGATELPSAGTGSAGDDLGVFHEFYEVMQFTDPEELIQFLTDHPELVAFLLEFNLWGGGPGVPIPCPVPAGLETLYAALTVCRQVAEAQPNVALSADTGTLQAALAAVTVTCATDYLPVGLGRMDPGLFNRTAEVCERLLQHPTTAAHPFFRASVLVEMARAVEPLIPLMTFSDEAPLHGEWAWANDLWERFEAVVHGAYRRALEVYRPDTPLHRVRTLLELCDAQLVGPRRASPDSLKQYEEANLQQAAIWAGMPPAFSRFAQILEQYEEAAGLCSRSRSPELYGEVQERTGWIYEMLSQVTATRRNVFLEGILLVSTGVGGGPAGFLAEAVRSYEEAARAFRLATRRTDTEWPPERIFDPADRGTGVSKLRETLAALGNCYASQGHWRRAREQFLEAARLGAGGTDLLGGVFAGPSARRTPVAQLYSSAAYCAGRLRDPQDALLTQERGRARQVRDALRLRQSIPPSVPAEVRQMFKAAVRRVRAADWKTRQAGERVDEWFDRRDREAREASAALDRAVRLLAPYSPEVSRDVSMTGLRLSVGDSHTALLAFVVTAYGSQAVWLVGGRDGQPRLAEIPGFRDSDLRRLVVTTSEDGTTRAGWVVDHGPDSERWRGTLDHTLQEIGERLFAPVVAALPTEVDRLILAPTNGLSLFPLHAAALTPDGAVRLCDRFQVSYTASAQLLAALRGRAGPWGAGLYVVANPTADPKLILTAQEAEDIGRWFADKVVHSGSQGSLAAVTMAIRGRGYVHFASHGRYDWADPLHGGVDLWDGRLSFAKILQSDIDLSGVRLVTLSACETGVPDILGSEPDEFIGFPTGFLVGGAACVVSSLWPVDDLASALLIRQFYANHLGDRMTVSAALHGAQRWLRGLTARDIARQLDGFRPVANRAGEGLLLRTRRHYRYRAEQNPDDQPFAHPYYWAPFTLYGDGDWGPDQP